MPETPRPSLLPQIYLFFGVIDVMAAIPNFFAGDYRRCAVGLVMALVFLYGYFRLRGPRA